MLLGADMQALEGAAIGEVVGDVTAVAADPMLVDQLPQGMLPCPLARLFFTLAIELTVAALLVGPRLLGLAPLGGGLLVPAFAPLLALGGLCLLEPLLSDQAGLEQLFLK